MKKHRVKARSFEQGKKINTWCQLRESSGMNKCDI